MAWNEVSPFFILAQFILAQFILAQFILAQFILAQRLYNIELNPIFLVLDVF
jgi:hypothetical protein